MKDGAILSNSGTSTSEIDIPALGRLSTARRQIRGAVEEFTLKNGTCLYVLAEGRLVQPGRNRRPPLGGHGYELCQPGPVGGIHFRNHSKFEKQVYPVPEDIDREIARLKLASDAGGYRHPDSRTGKISVILRFGDVIFSCQWSVIGTRWKNCPLFLLPTWSCTQYPGFPEDSEWSFESRLAQFRYWLPRDQTVFEPCLPHKEFPG